MRSWASAIFFVLLAGATGCDCGGGDGDGMGTDGGGTDSGGGETDATTPEVDAFVPPDTGPPEVDAFVPPVDAGPMCIDVSGTYEGVTQTGDCGDSFYDITTPQSIVRSTAGDECDFTFVSMAPKRLPGLNGDVSIGPDGGFSDAGLMARDTALVGCSGVWDMAAETMTVTCPSGRKSEDCVVVIHRTGPVGT